MTAIRQHEEIKKQQPIVREINTAEKQANVDFLKYKKTFQKENQTGKTLTANKKGQKDFQKDQKSCGRCGKAPAHSLNNCAARDAECRKCHKKGHFAAVCRSVRIGAVLEEVEGDTLFLGAVYTGNKINSWKKTL